MAVQYWNEINTFPKTLFDFLRNEPLITSIALYLVIAKEGISPEMKPINKTPRR